MMAARRMGIFTWQKPLNNKNLETKLLLLLAEDNLSSGKHFSNMNTGDLLTWGFPKIIWSPSKRDITFITQRNQSVSNVFKICSRRCFTWIKPFNRCSIPKAWNSDLNTFWIGWCSCYIVIHKSHVINL